MISWYDAQEFIAQLNKAVPGLQARLPSEAEWECACRAGTMTPFSFGDNISPEQVNYDGNYPYHDAAKGEYRQTTVAVKSLPPNPWGLYEMHGNVWEWCADWYGAYPAGAATNPHGPDSDGYRVLRGGSWFFSGRRARSASRYWNAPGRRYDFFGFRLARGQEPGEAELGPGPGWGTPTWANATGKDKFGYWAEFYI
jgi:formylglycine-generating enzyme required for sulfatase activity